MIVCYDEFFSIQYFRSYLFLLGFYPQEYGYKIDDFESFEYRLTPYLDAGMSVWQPVMMQYSDVNPVPYALVLGLKHALSVSFWKVHNMRDIELTHWLNRRRVRIECVHQLAIGRRLPVTLAQYHQTIATFFPRDPRDDVMSASQLYGSKKTGAQIAEKIRAAASEVPDSDHPDPFL